MKKIFLIMLLSVIPTVSFAEVVCHPSSGCVNVFKHGDSYTIVKDGKSHRVREVGGNGMYNVDGELQNGFGQRGIYLDNDWQY